eukprot:COSAG02_NODE_9486_length_2202_cov_1.216833_2_plen_341_part_00
MEPEPQLVDAPSVQQLGLPPAFAPAVPLFSSHRATITADIQAALPSRQERSGYKRRESHAGLEPDAGRRVDELGAEMNRGIVLMGSGSLQQARVLFEKAMGGFMGVLGPHHAHTMRAQLNLADLLAVGLFCNFGVPPLPLLPITPLFRAPLQDLGEHAKSKKLYEQVIVGRTTTVGASSSETLMAQNNLANLLDDMGRVDEARELYERVVAGLTETCGPTHTETLMTQMNLAALLAANGDTAKAKPMYEAVLSEYMRQLGPTHTETLRAQMSLAALLADEGDTTGAKELFEVCCRYLPAQASYACCEQVAPSSVCPSTLCARASVGSGGRSRGQLRATGY